MTDIQVGWTRTRLSRTTSITLECVKSIYCFQFLISRLIFVGLLWRIWWSREALVGAWCNGNRFLVFLMVWLIGSLSMSRGASQSWATAAASLHPDVLAIALAPWRVTLQLSPGCEWTCPEHLSIHAWHCIIDNWHIHSCIWLQCWAQRDPCTCQCCEGLPRGLQTSSERPDWHHIERWLGYAIWR